MPTPGYRLAEALRNYVAHKSMPPLRVTGGTYLDNEEVVSHKNVLVSGSLVLR